MIAIEHLTRDYGEGRGIFDLSLRVKHGEVFGYLGPNGAGKTTTIRHLMGFLTPKKGTCAIDGLDCFKQAADISLYARPRGFDSRRAYQRAGSPHAEPVHPSGSE